MSDLTGLDQLEQRQQVASSRAKRHVPPAKHPKAPIKRSPEGAGTQEESSPTRPERREPSVASTGAEAQSPPVLRRRSRVRPTQVHLDETAEDHLSALKKRAVNADVALTRISTQLVRGKGSADFVAQGAVVPPGDGGVGGEAGLAEDGCVGAPVEADGDRVGGGGDRAGGFQEAALQNFGGDGGVAGQPRAERGDECLGEYAEHDVEVDVEVDGGGQGVGVEGLDDLGEALFDGHASGVVLDQG